MGLIAADFLVPESFVLAAVYIGRSPYACKPPTDRDFPADTVLKHPSANAGDARDLGSICGLEWYPEGNSNPLQYSCLENSMDRGAWWGTAHGVTKSQTEPSIAQPNSQQEKCYFLLCSVLSLWMENCYNFKGHSLQKGLSSNLSQAIGSILNL